MASTKPRLPSEISVEELLNSLEDSTEESSLQDINDDIVSFLLAYGIKPGPNPVQKSLFYSLYRKWSKNPLEKSKFYFRIKKFLITHQKGPNLFYLIDKDVFKVTEEIQKFVLSGSINKTKSKKHKTHFENYLKKYNISPGDFYVESYILYYLYDKWVYSINKKTPLGEDQFFNFCKLYFNQKRNSVSRISWFGVDKESFLKVMPYDKMEKLRESRKTRYGKKKQKECKTIPSN
jgi:hypothetical protein